MIRFLRALLLAFALLSPAAACRVDIVDQQIAVGDSTVSSIGIVSDAVFATEHAYADLFVGQADFLSASLRKISREINRLTPFGEQHGYAFVHHKLIGITGGTGDPPPSWSNTYSCKYAGSATATAARTNWGQPSAWCLNPAANAYSFSFWFRSNTGGGQDASGALLTSANQAGNSHMRTGTSGTAINNIYAGGNFVSGGCSASITANTWTLVTYAFDGAGNAKMYVGNTSTSCITFSTVGTQTCTMDFLFNTLRGSDNTNVAFGEWGTPHMDEMTVWSAEITGTDHQAMISGGGGAVNPATNPKAANLIDYYRCGDDPLDSSTTLYDQIGSVNGTHSGSDGVTYVTNVP